MAHSARLTVLCIVATLLMTSVFAQNPATPAPTTTGATTTSAATTTTAAGTTTAAATTTTAAATTTTAAATTTTAAATTTTVAPTTTTAAPATTTAAPTPVPTISAPSVNYVIANFNATTFNQTNFVTLVAIAANVSASTIVIISQSSNVINFRFNLTTGVNAIATLSNTFISLVSSNATSVQALTTAYRATSVALVTYTATPTPTTQSPTSAPVTVSPGTPSPTTAPPTVTITMQGSTFNQTQFIGAVAAAAGVFTTQVQVINYQISSVMVNFAFINLPSIASVVSTTNTFVANVKANPNYVQGYTATNVAAVTYPVNGATSTVVSFTVLVAFCLFALLF